MTTFGVRLAHGRTLSWAPFRPALMGILNATPDSFSDGGRWLDPDAAAAHAAAMLREGAAIIDVGGESTRPGAPAVSAEEELRRVLPVIEGIVALRNHLAPGDEEAAGPLISIDTSKALVARRAIEAGAHLINDVTAGLGDADMLATAAATGAGLCLMHMRGTPRTMQHDPRYDDVVAEVAAFLRERAAAALASGVPADALLGDPGIGFGKTVEHNVTLLRDLRAVAEKSGLPQLVGVSRKSFLARLVGADPATTTAADRDPITQVAHAAAIAAGAAILRAHDVGMARDAIAVAAPLFR